MLHHDTILEIASHFKLDGTPVAVKELTAGNINITYRLDMGTELDAPRYVLQRINTCAFRDPESLMENVRRVTSHIRAGLEAEGVDTSRRVLRFATADNGTLLYTAPAGTEGEGAWRAYRYVDDVTAYDRVESPSTLYEAGRGFGEFQTRLSDFPADVLTETIPHFHDTPYRYETFLRSVEADRAGRAAEVAEEIAFINSRCDLMHGIVDRLASGELPLRVTHNDTKVNNVLIDNQTRRALCVIDLDTVMPGSSLYDYGDAIRFGACTADEDEKDISKIDFDMTLFEAFTRGFVEMAGNLTRDELLLLPLGALVLTCELAMRFLTDYLDGDVYFKTRYPGHNLVRTRAQMQLLRKMEDKYDAMCAFVASLVGGTSAS